MIAITISSDFAPEWAIKDVLALLDVYTVKTTWFSTEKPPQGHLIQPAIYANFMPGSTQGKLREHWRCLRHSETLDSCLQACPEAKSVRTRSMYDSEWLMEELLVRTSITHDSCLFLPNCDGAKPFQYRRYGKSVTRVPVTWQDYYWLFHKTDFIETEHMVLDFHVKHIAHNSPSIEWYEENKDGDVLYTGDGGVRDIFISYARKHGEESKWITEFEAA